MLYASDAATIGVEVVTQVISLPIGLPTPDSLNQEEHVSQLVDKTGAAAAVELRKVCHSHDIHTSSRSTDI